ncbi:MAG TPA: UDP-3-O-(3-hydroxymyristoyl)glucosamine N-acyltransferase [Candidatus Eremiobacteraeota bacterium]|nr:UDP-3-O-(3-hydroxymyristoyl)glucosamine N-acyltransferase [Candidatus Eremiobacteraeota bacterium]
MLLEEIAKRLGCKLIGNGNIDIKRVAGIKDAVEGDITFLANPRYTPELRRTKASAVIISHDYHEIPIPTLRTDNPYLIFAKAVELFYVPLSIPREIHPTAVIAATAHIGKNSSIYPYVVIGENVFIGDNVVIYPNVTIYPYVSMGDNVIIHSNSVIREYTEIGNNVIIQNGTVIGGDGFSFARKKDGTYYKIIPDGKVIIEDDVEIQSNSVIDRATVGNTIIKKGAKIDNLVQIGHGCNVGENTILCGQVGLAGSAFIGNNVIFAGQSGSAGHITIEDNVCITAKTAVFRSITKPSVVSGVPGMESSLWKRAVFCFGRLPELLRKLRRLEKTVNKLEEIVKGL